ncbi:HesA/MoeB/ThiF family protein [Temperatibacter marinus]|uniref:Molybdopterin-synthase adenylyltransferase n=1 Tax=Temperatibacter marinus TaxID=1456591 RepID=A0AA52EIX4_9PROT|nr:HesA/MoeB/ThiF family protein [Temperatibacter marinus]WND03349.1 HesA/MoeB/ThiF family protein [Temperatibacter marinus]
MTQDTDLLDLTDDQLDRYSRHLVLRELGGAGQLKLLKAKVLVIGAGGLGSPLLHYLAAAGIGTLGIIDHDSVDLSNLQRQTIHKTENIGTSKTESARQAIHSLNPDVCVQTYPYKITANNAKALIGEYDIVADGCDNFETRLLVSDMCVALKKPLVSAALGPFDGQLAVFKPHAGEALPCYRCFVPSAPPRSEARSCSDVGIIGALAGVMGSMQALEVIREISDFGPSTAGQITFFDAMTLKSRMVKLPKDPACSACGDS